LVSTKPQTLFVEALTLPGNFQEEGYEPLVDVKLLVDYFVNQNKQC